MAKQKMPKKTADMVVERSGGMCEANGCARKGQCQASELRVCLMHYKRWKRHGDVNVSVRKQSPPNPNKRTCEVSDCNELEDGWAGLCKLHDTRKRRHGDPSVLIQHEDRKWPIGATNHNWSEIPSYSAVHQRLRVQRGSASSYPCVDCGDMAAQWSYDREDPSEMKSEFGPYSANLGRYEPRCVPCHKTFDLGAINGRAK